jgi:hypothetical protein
MADIRGGVRCVMCVACGLRHAADRAQKDTSLYLVYAQTTDGSQINTTATLKVIDTFVNSLKGAACVSRVVVRNQKPYR